MHWRTLEEPGLPFPWVTYSEAYWPWVFFQRSEGAQVRLCECFRPAIKTFLDWNQTRQLFRVATPPGNFAICFVAGWLAERDQIYIGNASDVDDVDLFEPGCCHICQRRVPSRRYSVSPVLESYFGWYVKLEMIAAVGNIFDRTPVAREAARKTVARRLGLDDRRKVMAEDILFLQVRSIVGDEPIYRNLRPPWLGGLEVDIFLPNRRLAVEYQGIQHLEPVPFFGGAKGLKIRNRNDRLKRRLLKQIGVRLLYFTYEDSLDRVFVASRLSPYL